MITNLQVIKRAEKHRKVWNGDVASKIQTVENNVGQTTSFFIKSFGKKKFLKVKGKINSLEEIENTYQLVTEQ